MPGSAAGSLRPNKVAQMLSLRTYSVMAQGMAALQASWCEQSVSTSRKVTPELGLCTMQRIGYPQEERD